MEVIQGKPGQLIPAFLSRFAMSRYSHTARVADVSRVRPGEYQLTLKRLVFILLSLASLMQTGCIHIPPEVAVELQPSDGTRPNHYRRSPDGYPKPPVSAASGN